MKQLTQILNRAIQARIASFKVRNDQMDIFKQSNDICILSLQAKLKGDMELSDNLWQDGINLKNEAKCLGDKSTELQEKASSLEGIYYVLVEEFSK